MALPGRSSPPASRSKRRRVPSVAASNIDALPVDMLFDDLLRLPTKKLCRLCNEQVGRGRLDFLSNKALRGRRDWFPPRVSHSRVSYPSKEPRKGQYGRRLSSPTPSALNFPRGQGKKRKGKGPLRSEVTPTHIGLPEDLTTGLRTGGRIDLS
ncbi:unnamed protein product [Urochloa humidicola]